MTDIDRAALHRRTFLAGVTGVAGAAALTTAPADRAAAAPRHAGGGDPFTLGVASGDPTATGVVLWTRLAPRPFEPGGGMPAWPVTVRWEVARDERFRHVVRAGVAWAAPQLAHAVHVEVEGLRPDGEWFYRFHYRDATSATGRTRTAPADDGVLRLAVASCQRYDDGYFPSYRHIADDDLDLVVHLGDYVYEYDVPADGGYRRTPVPAAARPAPRDLDQWRIRYALYKSDPLLQAAHARHPWAVTWDDHEVRNDYANTTSQDEPDLGALRAAAYQAWYEHQPVRAPARPGAFGPRIYRRLHWGRLAQLDMLDGRQYRDVPPCGWGEAPACPGGGDPAVTMLGRRQERWLYDGLARSRARWNLLGNNVMLGRLDHDGDAGNVLWHDAWDGYPAARRRLTGAWARHKVSNPVVLTGDWHSTFVNDIRRDFDDPASPVVASEFVGTSIASNGDKEVYGPYYGPMIGYNPHIRFFDGDRRGWIKVTVGRDELRADLRVVDTVSRPDAAESTLASFVVDSGRPGPRRV